MAEKLTPAEFVQGLIFLGLIAVVVWFSSDKIRYSITYDTLMSHVSVLPKPRDCDFTWAPLGDKGCHYEKIVSVFIDE